MKQNTIFTHLLLIILVSLVGCSGVMHGYTKSEARNQYLKVDVKKKSFGFQRVNYIIAYRGDAIANFIEEKGYPDFIYEYEKNDDSGDEREGFTFYYFAEMKAYDFMEKNWRQTSARIVDIREFNKFEKSRFGL